MNDDELKEVFNSIDEDGSGELDVNEFAKAIKASIGADGDFKSIEDDDDNWGSDYWWK